MSSLAPFIRFSSEETKVSSSFEVFKIGATHIQNRQMHSSPPPKWGTYRGNKQAFQQYNTYQEELSPQSVFIN